MFDGRSVVWLLALAACGGSSAAVPQRGIGPRVRLPTYDGQPMTTRREASAYVEGGKTASSANLARLQFGATMRSQLGASSDGAISIEGAPSLLMERSADGSLAPPAGIAVGIGGSLRTSLLDGPFRIGVVIGGHLWRIPVVDTAGQHAGLVRPTGYVALVPSVRLGSVVAFVGLSLQSAVTIPKTHPAGYRLEAEAGKPGAAANAGVRVDLTDETWLTVLATIGADEAAGSVGGGLAIGRGFD